MTLYYVTGCNEVVYKRWAGAQEELAVHRSPGFYQVLREVHSPSNGHREQVHKLLLAP
jgi:hypothetical protein